MQKVSDPSARPVTIRPFAAFARRLAALSAALDLSSARSAYVARSIVAAGLALGLAYLLELEMPYSAASTVLLVINPTQGAVIGKGAWRIIGTLVGMLVAFLLMSVAGQMPLLFILGFGFWLGLCVACMTLLRHFRASGAVVAGYTIGLATYGAMGHPESTFEHVMSRGSTVVVGVVCLGLVTSLLSSRGIRPRLEGLYAKLAASVAGAIARQHGAPRDALEAKLGVVADIYGVDDLLALGKAESEDLALRAAAVRNGMVSLFAALVGGAAPLPEDSDSALALARLQPRLLDAWATAERLLAGGLCGVAPAREELWRARADFTATLATVGLEDIRENAALLIAADRLLEQLDAYLEALAGLAALAGPRPRGGQPRVHFHRDYAGALQNGLRSMLAIVLAGLFWLETGWTSGDMMLLVLAPYCALLATAGNPAAGALEFFKGTVYAVPAAFVCAFGVFPHLDGFPLLLVTLGLFWLPGIYATSVPRTALAGLAYLVAFNTLAAATNPMYYGVHEFFNFSVAWVLATLFAVLTFQLILPRNPSRDMARLRDRTRSEALFLLGGGRLRGETAWQQRQQHRVAQLGLMLKTSPKTMVEELVKSLAAIHVGREMLRIRRTLREQALPEEARRLAEKGLRQLRRCARQPSRAVLHARRTARLLGRLVDGDAERQRNVRKLMAAFADIHWLVRRHADYFDAGRS
ncbi:FUSC family protein [Pseudomonas aeruginosa]|nr:FUSC family protein [Pseudomonas aeruginosa]RTW70852.1 FUSC family protein [Pseudomonas aeruginosa]TEH64646.1 FUSC family protein [Pseudomonas aeruginosa]HBP6727994.1 FUSC family protein [Pseudomonas aeruginosa]